MSHRMFLLVGLACLPLVAQQPDGEDGPAKPAVILPALKNALAALVPAAGELGGAIPGERRFYGADLYEYIDGGAEPYHGYGMAAMVHQEYKVKDAELTIDIYDMGDPLSAFGIYSSERSPDYQFLAIGAEGYGEDATLSFLQGRFYVKLTAFREGGGTAPLLKTCAAAISKRIGGGKTLPEGLKLLPSANRVARSEKYIKKAPLGHDSLAPAYAATYSFGAKPTTVALSLAASPTEAGARARELREHFAKTGKLTPQPAVAPGAAVGSNRYEGEVLFFVRGRYLVLIVNPPPDPTSLVKALTWP